MASPRAQAAAAATQSKGLPAGFKAFSPFPFAGMNVEDAPIAVADQEFTYIENFLRLGAGKLRTAWDVGAALYAAPTGKKIVSFFFYTIGTTYYVALFLSDGSAVQVNTITGAQQTIGPPSTFYQASGPLPACSQWGSLYLLICNRNTPNDYWAWDGTTLYQAGTAAPNGVNLLATGQNYNSLPTVTAFGGHGSGMTFTPFIQAGGVVNVQINNPGTGYQVGDVVQLHFSGGGSDTSPQLMATLNLGSVSAANITAPGSGYTTASAAFSGGGGSGAAGTPIISTGSVTSVAVTAVGSGYTGANVSFSGGGGSGASAIATVNGGQVVAINVITGGSGYTSAPSVTISGDGTGATATASVSAAGQIIGLSITNGGSNYTSAPSIVISGNGAGATAVALLNAGSVSGVTVIDGGSGFVYAPLVTFVGGGGTGATGVATLTPTSVSQINMIAPGQNYTQVPTVEITGGGNGTGATATALIRNGQVIEIVVTNAGSGYDGNVEAVIKPAVLNHKTGETDTGTGAAAVVYFAPTSISGVQMSNYGLGYTDAPAVEVSAGANKSAYATVTLMPFGVSGSTIETFSSRVWIANPDQQPYATEPSGGNWAVSAPGSFTDFATSDGGVLFTNSDAFLQTRYVGIKQSNGYLYFFGDGSISVVSNVNTTGNPATTTFNYQNVDPQTGCSWVQTIQDFGRTILFGNETGVFGLYGGSATKISQKLKRIFENGVFPPPNTDVTTGNALAPTSAVATLFNIKHYMMLMSFRSDETGQVVNKMVTWNEKEWVLTSQSVNLQFIGTQAIESKFYAWGTDGNALYPLFNAPSSTLIKQLDTKVFGADNPLMIKDFYGLWMSAQDQSVGLAGIDFTVNFDISGLAVQSNPVAPRLNTISVPNVEAEGGGVSANLLYYQPNFASAPPYWSTFGTGTGGAPFVGLEAELTTTSPDFILSHLVLGYSDHSAFFAG